MKTQQKKPRSKRHLAREYALQMLYAQSATSYSVSATTQLFWYMKEKETDEEVMEQTTLNEMVKNFATDLVQKTITYQDEIDQWIMKSTEHWDLSRLAQVDKLIIRMAISEMLYIKQDIPVKVTINEAIELAKEYSTENSGRFVNGILDRIRRDIQADHH